MNITEEVLKKAESLGLDAITTGGGMDYVWIRIPKSDYRDAFSPKDDSISKDATEGLDVILMNNNGDGSPECIDEPCIVGIYFNESWNKGITFHFSSCMKAMDFMIQLKRGIAFGLEKNSD